MSIIIANLSLNILFKVCTGCQEMIDPVDFKVIASRYKPRGNSWDGHYFQIVIFIAKYVILCLKDFE